MIHTVGDTGEASPVLKIQKGCVFIYIYINKSNKDEQQQN